MASNRGPRYKIRFRGPLSRQLVRWIERLIPVLRDAPPEVEVTVEIDARATDPPDDAVQPEP